MAIRNILKLGNPRLYQTCEPVTAVETESLAPTIKDLHDTLMDFKARYGAGRAIAAPQIGVMKRLVYLYIDAPVVYFNPRISDGSKEMITIWDDCMSFPELMVKVLRHKQCRITYRDRQWQERSQSLADDLSELLQHEVDHLDGVLAVDRAIDGRSFAWRSEVTQ